MAGYLDNNNDGCPDDPKVAKSMVDKKAGMILMTEQEFQNVK